MQKSTSAPALTLAALAALSALLLLASCGQQSGASAPGSTSSQGIQVAVSILPQEWFVRQVGGDMVSILVLVEPGQSPHSWEPRPSQMAALAQSGAWITSGLEFEHGLMPKVRELYPAMQIVEGFAGVSLRPLEAHDHEGEDDHAEEVHEGEDGHEGEEDHEGEEGLDPHTWLGNQGALAQLAAARDVLVALDPAGKDQYQANHDAAALRINEVFAGLRTKLAPLSGRAVLVYHPAFGYFLDEFGLEQIAIETGGKEPGPRTLEAIIAEAREENAAVVFVQKQFPTAAATTVAESLGAQVVPLDDLDPDWLGNITRMGDALLNAAK